jgi:hypothetical protein
MTSGIASAAAVPPPRTTTPNTQQLAQLNKMVNQYKTDLSRNVSAQVLASLAHQIATAANGLGQHVRPPRANGSAAPTANTAAPARSEAVGEAGKLDVAA